MSLATKTGELATTLQAGDRLEYEVFDELGDMMTEEIVRGLRKRGLRMNREDSDCVWIEKIQADE